MLVVLAGLWGALARLGYQVPAAATSSADHGILMSLGFIGTLIAVERAVALDRWWAWVAPVSSAAGSMWLVAGGSTDVGRAMLVLAGVVLVVTYIALDRIQRSTHNTLMGVGALGWVAGAAFWLAARGIATIVPWLAVFLVVTITAERLELSRLLRLSRSVRRLLVAGVLFFVAGAAVSVWSSGLGIRICGAGIFAMACWLARFDLARRTVSQRGVTRFMAVGLLAGYAWLAVGGGLWLGYGFHVDDAVYDAQLHAVFLGFVMSMIFAHAPVIAPAVVRRPLPYRPLFYGPLVLLHVSLVLRVVGGDVAGSDPAWRIGGILNEIAILAFIAVTASAFLLRRKPRAPVSAGEPVAEPVAVRRRLLPPVAAGAGLGVVVLVAAVAVANTGSHSASEVSGSVTATGTATGATSGVAISLREMRIDPSTVTVVPGEHLILRVTNNGNMRHNLKLSSGVHTALLKPGETTVLDAGIVSKAMSGWCTLPGHRAAGMAMRIELGARSTAAPTTSLPPGSAAGGMAGMAGMGQPAAGPTSSAPDAVSTDLAASPPAGWRPIDAALPPVPAGTVHDVTWHMRDVTLAVAPGVTQRMWTFGGTVPGPVLHGRVGDTFNVTLINDTTMTHNIDFHAESGPPATVMTEIPAGGQHTYHFVASHAGAWLYHCGTEPMLLHMGNGMYGALIVDPPDLRPAATQYVLVGSQFFFGPQGEPGDYAKMASDRPDAVVFNGYPFAYQHAPLRAKVGDLVRVWVVDAGPNAALAFHVVGAPFTTAYLDGSYLLRADDPARGAAQTLPVDPGDGGFVELTFDQPGSYPFLTHDMADAVIGAAGAFNVVP